MGSLSHDCDKLPIIILEFVINWFSFFFYKGAHKEREGHLHVK